MNVNCVVAKYDSENNAVAEHLKKTFHNIEDAESWLKNENKPAMIYIDGMQNHDAFLDLCCSYNSQYWLEYKKVKD